MLFNSSEFIFFFAAFFPLYWLVQKNLHYRNLLILAGSYFFYGSWDWRFLSLILLSTVVDFYCGQAIYRSREHRTKRLFLLISLLTNLGILATFKYLGFFVNSFVDLLHSLGLEANYLTLNIILPVGISFYTFQTLSYTIDIYKGKLKPTHNFTNFAAFVAFFPQLVAGPIERATHLLPQIESSRRVDFQHIREGSFLVLWGLTKKVLIADRLAVYVDVVFADPSGASSAQALLAVLFFTVQIYCDFSGYSDIARGIAKTLGFDLMVNFNTPYFATSIKEFWQRWHISLSTWFRDYVYIPLGGNRAGEAKAKINLMITFLVSGLWHGANYTFVVWGALHAGGHIVESLVKKRFNTNAIPEFAQKFMGTVWTFTFVAFCWIFFRAENLSDAGIIISSISSLVPDFVSGTIPLTIESFIVGMNKADFMLSVYFVLLLFIIDSFLKDRGIESRSTQLALPVRWAFSWFLVLNFLMLSPSDSGSFIYFQF